MSKQAYPENVCKKQLSPGNRFIVIFLILCTEIKENVQISNILYYLQSKVFLNFIYTAKTAGVME